MLLASHRIHPTYYFILLFIHRVLTLCCLSSPLLAASPTSKLHRQRFLASRLHTTVFLRQHRDPNFVSQPSPNVRLPMAIYRLESTHDKFFRNPTKPKFPAALFSQPLRQPPSNLLNASVPISNFMLRTPISSFVLLTGDPVRITSVSLTYDTK